MKKKAIFLDRDGVINTEVNYLYKKDDFEFTHHCIRALKTLQEKGYLLFIITNQAGIGRGYYTEEDFKILNSWMLKKLTKHGVNITEVKFCPHHPEFGIGKYKTICDCRKPNAGMITSLIKKYNLDPNYCILVGDKISDINAGKTAEIANLVLVKSGHPLPSKLPNTVDFVYDNLAEFASELESN